jgi:hypothetical protein
VAKDNPSNADSNEQPRTIDGHEVAGVAHGPRRRPPLCFSWGPRVAAAGRGDLAIIGRELQNRDGGGRDWPDNVAGNLGPGSSPGRGPATGTRKTPSPASWTAERLGWTLPPGRRRAPWLGRHRRLAPLLLPRTTAGWTGGPRPLTLHAGGLPEGERMTEAEWLACTDPQPMLKFLRGNTSTALSETN